MAPASQVVLREELIFLLNQAAELEHSLTCSYLFTAFSLKSEPGDGLPGDTLEAVRRWKRTLKNVAIDEMLHLAMVNNLLVAVGASPHFDRPNFPHDCAYYLPEYQIELRAFDEATMFHFVAIEQPAGSNLSAVLDRERLPHIEGHLENEIGPDPYVLSSQRDVYYLVRTGLENLSARLGEQNVFIGPQPTESLRRFLGSGGWEPIVDLTSAINALDTVVKQGEGARADSKDSHYSRFRGIYEEYLALKQTYPDFEPAYPVLSNPFSRTPPEAMGEVNLIDDELTVRVSDLFNETYGAMLNLLGRFFIADEESDAEASTLCDASLEVMKGAIHPLGELLVSLPAGPGHPRLNAGPSFVVRTMHALPHKASAWHLLRERFGELSAYSQRLASEGSAAATLGPVGQSLAKVENMLVHAPVGSSTL
jgi:hypothetical protein